MIHTLCTCICTCEQHIRTVTSMNATVCNAVPTGITFAVLIAFQMGCVH